MFDYQLFFGYPQSDSFYRTLDQVSPALRALYIQSDPSSYLQQIEYEGVTYLGKLVDVPIEVETLEALETHIYSLLKCLVPQYSYEQPLLLLALPLPPIPTKTG